MEEGSQSDGGEGATSSWEADGRQKTYKGKSCKGGLFHSSQRRSQGRNPLCVGIPRTLPQVPGDIIEESEMEAAKEGRSLSNFEYVCVGYSVFLDHKAKPIDKGENCTELPYCVGIELLIDRRPLTAGHKPEDVHKEGDALHPQPVCHSQAGEQKSPQHKEPHFLNRLKRNAGVVASGVVRDMCRVGNFVKDMIHPK